jgi:septum formation inhibitor-activating ATPase MinD
VLALDKSSQTGRYYTDIARRLAGEEVPIDPIEDDPTLFERISGIFRGGR